MGGELDAAGNLANAGLVAGALEGREAQKGGEGPCVNCGAQLTGRYCANCGQPAFVHRSLWHLLQEALYNIFNFDTRAWRTLPLLIGRPGTLTRTFIEGKRARYVSPLALFLLCVFFMFFAFSFVHAPPGGINLGDDRESAVSDLSEARADLAKAQSEQTNAAAHPDHNMPAGLQARLAQQQVNLAQAAVHRAEAQLARIDRHVHHDAASTLSGGTVSTAPPATSSAVAPPAPAGTATSSNPRTVETTVGGVHIAASDQVRAPSVQVSGSPPSRANQRWQDQISDAARDGTLKINTGWPPLNERLRQSALNPDLALYKIQDAAYKWSFLLVPISLPFIAFLFLFKRGITLFDHTVFALNSLSFASLAFIAMVVTTQYEPTKFIGDSVIVFGLPVHTFFHLKGAYALKWWSALWRTFFILFFALIALTIYCAIILILGLAG